MITPFDYEKPEVVDFNSGSAFGKEESCYIDCTSDSICPNDDEY